MALTLLVKSKPEPGRESWPMQHVQPAAGPRDTMEPPK